MPQTEAQSAKKVFLSYNRTDRDASIALRLVLEQAGLNVFQDEDAIRSGDRWVEKLQQALKDCCAFVVLVGQDGTQRWVGAEVQTALIRHLSPHDDAERLPIFPILLSDAKPELLPPFLALFQADRWIPADPLPERLIQAILTHSIRINSQHVIEDRCPYLGLCAFSRNDARLFFGRRQETLEALTFLGDQSQTNPDKLQQTGGAHYTRWLQIEGNSGSGKSSLVQAGMLPMIERGALWARTGFEHWRILGPMMPGKNPLVKLAEILEHGLIDDPAKRDIDARKERLSTRESGLASTLKGFKQAGIAFLLIVDQFEELFTFADEAERKQFDALLATALQDPDCPLFLINTVRADFLDRFEYLPRLQDIYNRHCKRYFLPVISPHGLREIIEQPARLAGLDVTEVTTAILNDAKDEIGALPLVENALSILWQHQNNNRLSGEEYQQQGGLAGMLSTQADKLMQRIDQAVPKGKLSALELLLRLTRINDEGRHTRQRITLEEAIFVAGNGDDKSGKQVVEMLSGQRDITVLNTEHQNVLRLITPSKEQDQHYVDLIHETLVRARGKDEKTGKLTGYWPTLYDYIEKNRDRDLYRQQLAHESKQWQQSKGFGRLWNLKFFDLNKYRALRIPKHTTESRFLTWSRRAQVTLVALLAIIVVYGAESIIWVQKHDLSLDMIWTLQRFRLGYAPLPALTEKSIPSGSFNMGEQDAAFIAKLGEAEKNFGVPGKPIEIAQPFYLEKTEVTYEQYDYYVWQQHRSGNTAIAFPNTAKGGRGNQPVVNVNWFEAVAYANWLGERTNNRCRLPTEAEWEYAARAKTTRAYYPWGNELGRNNANCDGCGSQWDNKESAPVGSFSANQFGLYDMSGNVWEWTCSNWRNQFDGNEQQCNDDTTDTQSRVVRGGSWYSSPDFVRTAARGGYHPVYRVSYIGFRVLCSPSIE